MSNIKLTGASRFISPKCGISSVVIKGEVITVTKPQEEYLVSLTSKDKSNNIHPLFISTEEVATASADAQMSEQQRLAKAVIAEANGEVVEEAEEAEEVKVEEAPAPKRRAKKAAGTRGTRNASKVVA